MNERIRELIKQHGINITIDGLGYGEGNIEGLVEMILKECAALNKTQSYDLMGVIADTEEGDGFDDVCLNTVKRVADYLGDNSLAKHFGVEE